MTDLAQRLRDQETYNNHGYVAVPMGLLREAADALDEWPNANIAVAEQRIKELEAERDEAWKQGHNFAVAQAADEPMQRRLAAAERVVALARELYERSLERNGPTEGHIFGLALAGYDDLQNLNSEKEGD